MVGWYATQIKTTRKKWAWLSELGPERVGVLSGGVMAAYAMLRLNKPVFPIIGQCRPSHRIDYRDIGEKLRDAPQKRNIMQAYSSGANVTRAIENIDRRQPRHEKCRRGEAKSCCLLRRAIYHRSEAAAENSFFKHHNAGDLAVASLRIINFSPALLREHSQGN